MKKLFEGFEHLGTTRESIWTKIVTICIPFMMFLINILIVLVPASTLLANGNSGYLSKVRRDTNQSDYSMSSGQSSVS